MDSKFIKPEEIPKRIIVLKCLNKTSNMKKYKHDYYIRNKEKILIQNKKWRKENIEKYKKSNREYERKTYKIKSIKYLGVMFCSKCNRKGYGYIYTYYNIKTKHIKNGYLQVKHFKTINGKSVYDGCCYIGKI